MTEPRRRLAIPAAFAALIVSTTGVFVAREEGMVLQGYADPIWGEALPTECAGETGPHVELGVQRTLEYCLRQLEARTTGNLRKLQFCIQKELTVNQWVAVLSLTHNIGVSATCSSTMVKLINKGAAAAIWCRQLTHARNSKGEEVGFTYARGKRIQGLINRRQREYEVCIL